MNDVVTCPTCGIKFRFTGTIPRSFTCKSCGAPMDLSAYLPPEPEPIAVYESPPAAPAAAVAPAAVAPPRQAAAARGGRREEESPHGQRHFRKRGVGTGVIVLGCVGVVVLIAIVVVVLQKTGGGGSSVGDKVLQSAREAEQKWRGGGSGSTPPPSPPPPAYGPPQPAPPPPSRTEPKPEPRPTSSDDRPKPSSPKPAGAVERIPGDIIAKSPVPEDFEVKTYPYAADVSADDRNRIDESIRTAVDVGGKDGRDAERLLVSMGKKAVPRLISEFKAVGDHYGYDKPEGLMRGMVLDRVLRQFDGVQERLFHDYHPMDVDRDAQRARRTVQNWNWWWATGEHEKNPRKPWDPRVDAKDDPKDLPPEAAPAQRPDPEHRAPSR